MHWSRSSQIKSVPSPHSLAQGQKGCIFMSLLPLAGAKAETRFITGSQHSCAFFRKDTTAITQGNLRERDKKGIGMATLR